MRTKQPPTQSAAWWALKKMGSCAAEVADRLRAEAIKGFRGHSDYGPLNRYLEFHGFFNTYVGASIYKLADFPPDRLPEACADFLRRFNDGEYPDLEQ